MPASAIWIPEIFGPFRFWGHQHWSNHSGIHVFYHPVSILRWFWQWSSKDIHRRVSIMTAKQEEKRYNRQPAQCTCTKVCWITSLVPGPISSPNLSAFTLPKQPKSWTQIGIQRLRRCVAPHPTNSGITAATPFAKKSHIRFCTSLWILNCSHVTRSLACE